MIHVLDHARPLHRSRRIGLADYFALARQRRALARMDAAQLRDLGISLDEARNEAARPVWDLPARWMR
jgi:uncharacterized protein YjiS (DUF1127 family)